MALFSDQYGPLAIGTAQLIEAPSASDRPILSPEEEQVSVDIFFLLWAPFSIKIPHICCYLLPVVDNTEAGVEYTVSTAQRSFI